MWEWLIRAAKIIELDSSESGEISESFKYEINHYVIKDKNSIF